ncbi:hypothetical protein HPB50_007323 [Hyalomma asiaticum]|uniref:Uncharacterized protein n=1 Tax=Hyalomma asiaticum TaxID=266040 RepID=A0ACB7SU75_HYAAI|nr:hypothetical protein HPB50_007323 [Hyalomma asiaticum]
MSLLDFRLAVAEALCASPKRKRLESNNKNVQPNHSTERSPGAAKMPGVDKRLDSYDHWPSMYKLIKARISKTDVGFWERGFGRYREVHLFYFFLIEPYTAARSSARKSTVFAMAKRRPCPVLGCRVADWTADLTRHRLPQDDGLRTV